MSSQLGQTFSREEKNCNGICSQEETSNGKPALNKTLFINNVCSCLDSCSSYIQSLNALCASGTVLAHSLLQVFHDLPPYRDAAEHFVSTWEELSKATAGASSGVKTETLMALQEVITSLEEEGTSTVTASIAAVGSCLLSYVELQSEFSLACWKSLSQLVQSISGDSLFLFPVSDIKRSLSSRTQELINSIRKYYGQVNGNCSTDLALRRSRNIQSNQRGGQNWEPMGPLASWIHHQSNSNLAYTADVKETLMQKELDEVLNLLSCQPASSGVEAQTKVLLEREISLNSSSSSSRAISSLTSSSSILATSSDTAIYKNSLAQRKDDSIFSKEGKRTWPRTTTTTPTTTSTHQGSDNQLHSFGLTSWIWGLAAAHADPDLDGHRQTLYSSLHQHQEQLAAPPVTSSSRNFPPWCATATGQERMDSERWSRSAQGENNSSSDEGSLGHLDNEVFSSGTTNPTEDSSGGANTSLRQRRHSSNCDGQADCEMDNFQGKANIDFTWESQKRVAKMSTWPLKQNSNPQLERFNMLAGGGGGGACLNPFPLGGHLYSPSTGSSQQNETNDKKYTLFGQIT